MTKFTSRGLMVIAIVLLLAGCAGGGTDRQTLLSGGSWPGLTATEDTIYMAFGAQVYAINDIGREVWSYPQQQQRNLNFFAPPTVFNDLILVTDYENRVHAIDRETGFLRWFLETEDRFIAGATVGDDYIYVADVSGVLYALEKEYPQNADVSVEPAWDTGDTIERDIWSTPVIVDDVVYVTSLDRHVYGFDAASGELIWRYPDAEEPSTSDDIGALVSTPTHYDGVLYFGSLNNNLYALDIDEREIIWQQEMPNWVWSSPLVIEEENMLIGGDLDGNIFAFDLNTGDPLWETSPDNELGFFETGGRIVGRPLLSEGEEGQPIVYVASGDTNLYTLDVSTGQPADAPATIENEFTARFLFFQTGTDTRPVPVFATPLLFEDTILLGLHQGNSTLRAYNIDTLLPRWTFAPSQ